MGFLLPVLPFSHCVLQFVHISFRILLVTLIHNGVNMSKTNAVNLS